MTDAPAIVLIDSNASDRTLATLLLQRDLPHAAITPVTDALEFADALAGEVPDVAVVACDTDWGDVHELVAILKRRRPDTAIVLFGREADLGSRLVDPGLVCDGLVRKSSAGFIALPTIVSEALGRRGRRLAAGGSAGSGPAVVSSRPNQELREIALVFSHDMREPVRLIERLARRGHAAGGGPVAARALQHVAQSAERVSRMLDDMVQYLTVTSRDATPQRVDLSACLDKAMANLRTVIDESHALVRATPLPASLGDEYQFVHLFQNLLSNSIKFHGRETPVITISVQASGDQWLLEFRDNGIGIPKEFAERIFELGQRLHTREEYPGSGIGLALCRRIVERHGGRIWADSQPGQGATFHVLLPRAPGDVVQDPREPWIPGMAPRDVPPPEARV